MKTTILKIFWVKYEPYKTFYFLKYLFIYYSFIFIEFKSFKKNTNRRKYQKYFFENFKKEKPKSVTSTQIYFSA